MAFDAEALAAGLGLEVTVVENALSLSLEELAGHVSTIAVDTDNAAEGILDEDEALPTTRAFQQTSWEYLEPDNRARAAVYFLGVLAEMGLKPYQAGEKG